MEKKAVAVKKYVINGLFIGLLALLLFVPSAKALVIRGLMEIGLYNPEVASKPVAAKPDLSGIRFKDAKGKTLSLADLEGKVIFLNFWATWCPPCLAEMPSVNKLYEQYKNDSEVVFLLVDADSDFAKSQAYMDRKKYALPVYNFASNLPETLFKGTLPTTVVFDKKGRLSYRGEGAANYASKKFVDFIEQLKALKN
ncbi:TlpA disulfide reductase family protein [Pedobacter sp. KR3-3]|uniref:TlpA disulfide reductase family protein n=1 Tax=Pedobacter albus TaxID=3113905 RepID=A0ABU7ICP3_9SPHI|nr:TlpA disulfide reductase family protein [Pedobacter sp. KR3-3]MEE1947268.1 TlpA disulfide reductase family protein [Pedobacter sp. KR3-3]